jgi:predicted metal-dependent phosphoesterase TrpH
VAGVPTPFDHDGAWFRCQLHAHTLHSDGEPTTPGLVEHYARAGYDVLAITDHWQITLHEPGADGSSDIFLLPSSELSARIDGGLEADVLAYGIDELPEPREEFASIVEAASWIVAQGGVAYLAHPYWSGLTADHYLGAPDLSGIEVYNGGSELLQGNGLSAVHWDDILQHGAPCLGIATDDSHYAGQDSRLGWTMLRAPERSRPAILDALRRGSFYGSTGAEIHGIEVHGDGHVDVRTSAARAVTLRSGRWDGCRVNAHPLEMHWRGSVVERAGDGAILAARFDPPEFERWGRVEVIGADGGLAWSNPFRVG